MGEDHKRTHEETEPSSPGKIRRLIPAIGLLLVTVILMNGLLVPGISSILSSQISPLGLRPEVIQDAEMVCVGKIDNHWAPFNCSQKVQLTYQHYARESRRKVVTFKVDYYLKGKGPKTIRMAVFQRGDTILDSHWNLPLEEMIVAVEKDSTESGVYRMVNPVNSWIALLNPDWEKHFLSPDENGLEKAALAELQFYAHSSERIRGGVLAEPLSIGALLTRPTVELDNTRILTNLFATIGAFRFQNPEFKTLIQQIAEKPDWRWPVRNQIFDALVQYDSVLAWNVGMKIQRNSQSEAAFLSYPLAKALTAETLEKVNPEEIKELLNSNFPTTRRDIAYALRTAQTRRALPFLAYCLNNSFWEVRYNGMAGLYNILGEHERSFVLPATDLFQRDPQKYLAPYKKWCEEHPDEIAMAQ